MGGGDRRHRDSGRLRFVGVVVLSVSEINDRFVRSFVLKVLVVLI